MSEAIKTTEIDVKRTIDAGPDEVYEAWLDPTCPGSPWFGVPKAIVYPPAVDGLFYSMYELEGKQVAHYGRFVVLDEPSRIQHTWVSEATHGMESVVTLTFEPVQDKTQVHVRHTNVPDDEGGRFHENAWKYVLAAMASRFRHEGTSE